ncbi:glutamine amidotransferase [Candidatus Saccharibacteria bacterium]|jgi:CobQ-like glutamine amidotransferase family enzyme|nr:glutamine amidotransferase [Candidatus Saccharibacteria bacterium]
MNIYGDRGNTLTLKKRLEWHNYSVKIADYNIGDSFPDKVDIIVGGGGQDSGQKKIQHDLQKISPKLTYLAEKGTPMLVVCGLYQLFGKFFKTANGETIAGAGIFNTETHAGPERLTGNVIVNSNFFGEIVGYENHSGQTFLDKNTEPLGKVVLGAGNNGQDESEGAIFNNVIGTYLHGAILPKNPQIADFLIKKAVINLFGEFEPAVIDDSFANMAREIAKKRPR